jgi:2-polyprenyl-6-hydroxyphenyl methylase/3-demethylubiquinone-9 3-methyltransferase
MSHTGLTTIEAAAHTQAGLRFRFGENWWRFLSVLDDERIRQAENSLVSMLEVPRFDGLSFLDVGCGSGLFSLAARRAGATVHSFDYDSSSVACASELKRRYYRDDDAWSIEQGSVLDTAYLEMLPQFDVVYSWGVLHHTGAMWQALENVGRLVKPGGKLFIGLYNDQGLKSVLWTFLKRTYNRSPGLARLTMVMLYFVTYWGAKSIIDAFRLKPFRSLREYSKQRGMSPWHDVVDWIGGYPFEVAKPEVIFNFFRARGFTLCRLITCGGKMGCNEYVFHRELSSARAMNNRAAAESGNVNATV